MNIYVTSECPIKSAQFLDDYMVKEMAKETARILSAALRLPTAYRTYDIYHPCVLWARKSRGNYQWLLEHFKALCDEYERRYKVSAKSHHLQEHFHKNQTKIPMGARTPFVNHSRFKKLADVMLAYRSDLAFRWVSYKKTPTWYNKANYKPSKECLSGSKSRAA